MKNTQKSIVIVFNSMNIGGIERKIVDLCNYFCSKTKVKIFLLLKEQSGIFLNSLPKEVCVVSPKMLDFYKTKTAIFPLWIASQIRIIKPDLILAFGNYCGISSLLARIFSGVKPPLIISEDSSIDKQIDSDTFSWLRKLLVKKYYPMAEKIITLTSAGKMKMKKIVKDNDDSKIVVAPNWLPYGYVNNTMIKNDKRKIDLLFLGRFEIQKNPLEFLKISKKLVKNNPQIKIAMVGYGSLEFSMKKYISENSLTKNVTIFAANTNPYHIFLDSKILLLSSIHEGFPLTILESSAAGCVPICRLMSETNSYFDYYPETCQYQSLSSAVKNIASLLLDSRLRKDIARYYQQKAKIEQSTNFNTTVNLIKKYL